MLILKKEDFLEVGVDSLIADYDREIIANLYQPIIGYKSVSLYFTLLTESNNQKINPIISHESFFSRTQMTAGDFIDSRQLLEAVGLLRTFVSDLKSNKLYHYELYAPKTPKLFFDNTLLYGMLMKMIGENEANKLKTIYQIDKKIDGKEITASFMEVFTPDLDDPVFRKAMEKSEEVISRRSAKLTSGFDYQIFFEELSKISQIKSDAFSKEEMKEIERLSALYGISEERSAAIVSELYNPYGKRNERINLKDLQERFIEETNYQYLNKGGNRRKRNGKINGNTDLAHKISMMEKLSPKEFLSVLQNGSIPANSDLRLINDLQVKFNLPNCVINAIIDYVLAVNDNILSRPFAEKIAGSIAREGIETTIDAMDYLKKVSSKRKRNKKDNNHYVNSEEEIEDNNENNEENDEESPTIKTREELLKELEEDDDNGEN